MFKAALNGMSRVAGKENVERLQALGEQSGEWFANQQGSMKMFEDALKTSDEGRLSELLDNASNSGLLNSAYTPTLVSEAAQRVANAELAKARDSKDPKQLRGAMVMADRLGATKSKEYEETMQLYRQLRKLPDHWQALRTKRGRLLGRANMNDKGLVELFQFVFDQTFKRIETRDRQGKVPEKYQVMGVTEVQNEDGWCNYALRREEIQQEILGSGSGTLQPVQVQTTLAFDSFVPSSNNAEGVDLHCLTLDRSVNEVLLFHGTHPVAADAIADTAFKVNLAGSNAGTLYGRGIYLAESASKSDEYSKPDKNNVYTMLLCRAVLGRVHYTAERSPDPRACERECLQGPCHSVLGDRVKARGTFREFVVFDQDQIYPNFLVTYKRM